MSAIAIVVGRVTVHEAVGQDEVDGGVVPVELMPARPSRRAQAAAGHCCRRRVAEDFAAADGRDIAAVKSVDLAALGEGFANVDGQRFSIPLRTLADLMESRGAGLFFPPAKSSSSACRSVSTCGIQTPAEDAHCGGVPRQGSMESIWLSLMPPEACRSTVGQNLAAGDVPFSTTFWLMKGPSLSVKAGKSAVVQRQAIPGTNNVASAASFIAGSLSGFI